ncbi:MAG: FHA domain-containing protein, partial [Deltaproteobacteria bacterium]|nr:FHA domain-containing protein [Deltaproteobacteria bacterium]
MEAKTKSCVTLREVGSGKGHVIPLPCVIGRGSEADLKIPDSGVSHRHARIFCADDGLWIEDLQSRNGVYLENRRIEGKHPLREGDRVFLGGTGLIVHLEKAPAAEETIIMQALEKSQGRELNCERLALIYEVSADLAENRDLKELAGSVFA